MSVDLRDINPIVGITDPPHTGRDPLEIDDVPARAASSGTVPSRSSWLRKLQLRRDYRAHFPPILTRWIGYRSPAASSAPQPVPVFPFTLLSRLSLQHELWILGCLGAFVGILLVESIMSTSTAFRDVYHSSLIVASFGASAVLLYGAPDSPLSQPRNVIGGHLFSAIISVAITRLFARDPNYISHLENTEFHPATMLNGAISMSVSLALMFLTGTVHPPGGATALNAATDPNAVRLGWHYLPTILASALIMVGWALIINNVGRRRYPSYWWSPERCFVKESSQVPQKTSAV